MTLMKQNLKLLHTTLADAPEYRSKLKKLIETNFNYSNSNSLFDDFAPLFSKANSPNNHILIDKESKELIGHCGLWPRTIVIKDNKFPVVLIGGIAINQNYQGQGLFRKFFEDCLNPSQKSTSLYILWSDLSELYSKLGFYEVGIQDQLGLQKFNMATISKCFKQVSWRDLKDKEFRRIIQIHEQFTSNKEKLVYLERTPKIWNELKNISSTNLFLYYPENTNQFEGYFFINKGMDLPNIIHDYGCTPKYERDFFSLLSPYQVWSPAGLTQLSSYKQFYTCFMGAGDSKQFQKLLNTLDSDNHYEILEIMNGTQVHMKKNGKQEKISLESILRLYFGPYTEQQQADALDKKYHPLYIGGLESI